MSKDDKEHATLYEAWEELALAVRELRAATGIEPQLERVVRWLAERLP